MSGCLPPAVISVQPQKLLGKVKIFGGLYSRVIKQRIEIISF